MVRPVMAPIKLPAKSRKAEFMAMLDRFAIELLGSNGNATAALMRANPDAGWTTAMYASRASHLRKHARVQEIMRQGQEHAATALARALERYDVSAERVAAEMVRLAFTELRQVVDWGTTIDPKTGRRETWLDVRNPDAIDHDAHKALVAIERKPDGSLKVTLADKLAAQMQLARLKGYVQEKPSDPGTAVQFIIQR